MTNPKILFAVRGMAMSEGKPLTAVVFASDREAAKRKARDYLRTDPDKYIVSPITEEGDNKVFVEMTIGLKL